MRRASWTAACLLALALPARAAETLTVAVVSRTKPVAGAEVTGAGAEATTDKAGVARFESVEAGEHEVMVAAAGFLPATARVVVTDGTPARLVVELEPLEEQIIVSAARSPTRLQNQPLRVEVIDQDDIEEKALMTPGNVAMLLGETTGLRVQTTAPSLSTANVRVQGLRGRYSQLLADGLPLYGAQGDSFSLLQVPPLDLAQVEVIKGAASALYGPAALGGVINLVARRPRENEEELLLNGTTLGGVDATGWIARAGRWAWSVIGGYHGQGEQDVDGNGWADVAGYDRGVLRPRLTFDNGSGATLLATLGGIVENRNGGTVGDAPAPDGRPFPELLDTRHADAGAVGKWLRGRKIWSLRGSWLETRQDRTFGDVREHGTRSTWFAEGSLAATSGRHTWVAGGAFQQDRYDARDLPQFDYRFTSPAVFAQDEIGFGPRLALAASARADFHSEYGTLVSPRVSLLSRPSGRWTLRLSGGGGGFAPTPFVEETEETGLSRLQPLQGLRAERAVGASGDVGYHSGGFDVSLTLFGSRVTHPTQLQTLGPSSVALVNAVESTRTWGTELIGKYRKGELLVMLTHAFTRSTELDVDLGARREVPLTPRNMASLNVIWESEGRASIGVEAYYYGRQSLEDDPSLDESRPYLLLGALMQRRFGKLRLFLNVENVLDYRQTKQEPVVLPARRPDGRWTVDSWAPLDGRVFNGGVRVVF